MSLFTPVQGIIGGSLIGASASVLLISNGDIMGLSGIMSSLTHPIQTMKDPNQHWKLIYISSFVFTVNSMINIFDVLHDQRLEESREQVPVTNYIGHVIGGLLVGIGTKVGNGCTTGHGICGISRFSKRSVVAVVTFTLCGMITTAILSPQTPWSSITKVLRSDTLPVVSKLLGTIFTASTLALALNRQHSNTETKATKIVDVSIQKKSYGAAISGVMFASGLAISGMIKKSKVHDFLDLCSICRSQGTYDPTLMSVLGSAILMSYIGYQIKNRRESKQQKDVFICTGPMCGSTNWNIPTNTNIDKQLISGSALFGIGWGITGLCPGPALFSAAAGSVNVVLGWFPAFLFGSWTGLQIKESMNSKPKKA